MKLLFTFALLVVAFVGFAQQSVDLGAGVKNDIHIVKSNPTGMELLVTTNQFDLESQKTENGSFFRILLSGAYSNGIRGQVALPVINRFIQIPENAEISIESEIVSSSIVNLNSYSVDGRKLFPYQPSVSKAFSGKVPFYFDKKYYQTNAYSNTDKVSIEEKGHMRNIRLGVLSVSPFSYNPVENKIRVNTSIRIHIRFNNADLSKTMDLASRYENYGFSAMEQSILNVEAFKSKDIKTQYPIKYVIVADPMFQSALQPFVAWKTKKGFKVVEAYTNNAAVGNTTTSIKAYLKNMYDNATPTDPAQSFVLIVGDVAQIPAFSGTAGSHSTDLYYAEYTGDLTPDVYYGRFSATNVVELQPQIDKTLEYEQYLFPTENWLDTVVMIGGVDASWAPTHANGQINYGTTYYFNASNDIFSHTHLYPNSGSEDAQIISEIGTGCSFANYTAHGAVEGWADPTFYISNISSMHNEHKYPLMIGNACVTNSFNSTCFGEALLRADKKGAIGYIGASNNSYWDEDFYWGVGVRTTVTANPTYDASHLGVYDRVWHTNGEPFSDWYMSQGQMLMAGNLAVLESPSTSYNYYSEIYHLMGDPSLMIYLGVPTQLSLTHPAILPLGQTSITVTTEPYAYVGISQNGVWHGAGLADASGNLTIDIIPFTQPGTIDIVGTKQFRKPYIATIQAQTPTGPYVIYQSKTINDATGNNNQLADFTETVDLNIILKNYGVATANAVTATISTTDPNVTILDNSGSWGNISVNESKELLAAFRIKVDTLITDQHVVNFDMTVQDNASNNWSSSFSITLNAPVINILSLSVDDSGSGNNNHRLDPGETATLNISIQNDGHASLNPLEALLTTNSSYANITSAAFSHGLIANNAIETGTYTISVASNAVNGLIIPVTLNAAGMQYSDVKTFNLMVGQVDEDWESGDMTAYQWTTGGNAPWIISNANPYEGTFTAKSGVISDNQTSTLSVLMEVVADDTISFYRKVSSESGYDFLKFKIGSSQQGEWSGELDWERAAYPVSAGNITFTWVYEKDYSQSAGSDATWVDYIIFPPIGIPEGINETPDFSFGLFPNPANNQLRIELSPEKLGSYTINLTNVDGKLIRILYMGEIKAGQQSLQFDITGLASGTYFINILSNNGNSSRMMIKN